MSSEFNKENFCKRLVQLRKERKLTQVMLAEALGISDKTYSKWETGEYEPDLATVAKLADYYGVSPAVFFGFENRGNIEGTIAAELEGLPGQDAVRKAFEIQFHAIRGLAKCAFNNRSEFSKVTGVEPPENRINARNDHAITAFAAPGIYEMMYNGVDANIALSILPAREKYRWLITEREKLSRYLSLLGEEDMLRCLTLMMSEGFSECYSAGYLGNHAGVSAEKASELLERALSLGICSKVEVNTGSGKVDLFRLEADQMLLGILILAHLSLPEAEKNGHYYYGMPAREIAIESEVE